MQAAEDQYEFRVRWHPFLLRPQMPPEGFPKAPDTPDNPRVKPALKQAGQSVGIDFTGKADKYPNSVKAHVLLEYAKEVQGGQRQNDLAELFFKCYFTDGGVLEDDVLLDLAEKAGLDRAEAARAIQDEGKVQEIYQTAMKWSMKGINGVPYFYMNGQKTFSGAQDQSSFVRFFEIVNEKFPLKPGASPPAAMV